jgi:hypothetical protein
MTPATPFRDLLDEALRRLTGAAPDDLPPAPRALARALLGLAAGDAAPGTEALERVAAAYVAALRRAALERDGWRVVPLWEGDGRLLPSDDPNLQKETGNFSVQDHAYWLVDQAGREVSYMAEEYNPAIQTLTVMRLEGWQVELKPEWSLHFPGWTTAVWCRHRSWPARWSPR